MLFRNLTFFEAHPGAPSGFSLVSPIAVPFFRGIYACFFFLIFICHIGIFICHIGLSTSALVPSHIICWSSDLLGSLNFCSGFFNSCASFPVHPARKRQIFFLSGKYSLRFIPCTTVLFVLFLSSECLWFSAVRLVFGLFFSKSVAILVREPSAKEARAFDSSNSTVRRDEDVTAPHPGSASKHIDSPVIPTKSVGF